MCTLTADCFPDTHPVRLPRWQIFLNLETVVGAFLKGILSLSFQTQIPWFSHRFLLLCRAQTQAGHLGGWFRDTQVKNSTTALFHNLLCINAICNHISLSVCVCVYCQNPVLALSGSGMSTSPSFKELFGAAPDKEMTTKVNALLSFFIVFCVNRIVWGSFFATPQLANATLTSVEHAQKIPMKWKEPWLKFLKRRTLMR